MRLIKYHYKGSGFKSRLGFDIVCCLCTIRKDKTLRKGNLFSKLFKIGMVTLVFLKQNHFKYLHITAEKICTETETLSHGTVQIFFAVMRKQLERAYFKSLYLRFFSLFLSGYIKLVMRNIFF